MPISQESIRHAPRRRTWLLATIMAFAVLGSCAIRKPAPWHDALRIQSGMSVEEVLQVFPHVLRSSNGLYVTDDIDSLKTAYSGSLTNFTWSSFPRWDIDGYRVRVWFKQGRVQSVERSVVKDWP